MIVTEPYDLQVSASAAQSSNTSFPKALPLPSSNSSPPLCWSNKVELCFTPTYASWANPIEAHFGLLRAFVVTGSEHPNHTVATRALDDYLRWRNTNARHPDILAANAANAPEYEANANDDGPTRYPSRMTNPANLCGHSTSPARCPRPPRVSRARGHFC
ncbi:MAG TPA: hypothetical protein VGX25_25045 [Actinophytocola sp.]|uniref:hypothetical protein n=1 Tax=Actinophytocola sp. TaxID=1872138 RepID=UPI002DDCCC43|nr:hypothetical protein [Actinophytocola sp.]HEV2782671.1 hypothetical protein [Actinophytocola sp.]